MGTTDSLKTKIIGFPEAIIPIQWNDLNFGPFLIEPSDAVIFRSVINHNNLVLSLILIQGFPKSWHTRF
jgi:hypothetical protein